MGLSSHTSWEERGLTFAFACLLSYVPRWPFPAACGHSQGVALLHRLSHAAGLFSPFTWLETIGGRYGPLRLLRPAGCDVEKHASLYTCGFLSLPLNLGQCARVWSSAHVSNASYVEAVHEPHQHLGSFARQVLCSQVRRVGLGGDLLYSELTAAHRLLASPPSPSGSSM